jgi:RNA recognition motif-containing protein
MGHQPTLSDVHPRLHVVHPPPSAFPRHIGSPIREESMHCLAYVSPSTMTALPPHAPFYQYGRPPDLVPTSSSFPPSVSAPTSPPHSPPTLRHPVNGHLGSPRHSTPYTVHSAYTPMGYTAPLSYAYPSPVFVPAPSVYGSHGFPPHYSRPYTFPTGQESQGAWWYSPPGSTAAFHLLDGTQPEFQPRATAGYPSAGQLDGEPPDQPNTASRPFEPQPTRRPATRARASRPLNEAKQEAAQSAPAPTSPTTARTRHQERRSYHPNPPAHRSEWVMWVGNVPFDVTQDELQNFFNQPLPPAESGFPMDRQHQVYGGVLTAFLISRSHCAFVNFSSEAQLQAATARFHGQRIRPADRWCPRLVCRVRKREDDLMAGVGGQRGNGMHIKWVKEQKVRIQREQTGTVASPRDVVRSSSPLSVSSDDSGWIGEEHVGAHVTLSRSASIASTNSDILTHYFPQRYFILKSLTQVVYPSSVIPATISNTHVGRAIWT